MKKVLNTFYLDIALMDRLEKIQKIMSERYGAPVNKSDFVRKAIDDRLMKFEKQFEQN